MRAPRTNARVKLPVRSRAQNVTMSAETLTIDRLQRWQLAGGSWRTVEIAADHVVIELCACTGEPMQRMRSEDPAVIAQLRADRPPID